MIERILVILLIGIGLSLIIYDVIVGCKCTKETRGASANAGKDETILDIQFGSNNNPSEIYQDMFTLGTPWIGGYTLGDGKTRTFTR
jgi:hypothetical protein